jgi:hypothetical protein
VAIKTGKHKNPKLHKGPQQKCHRCAQPMLGLEEAFRQIAPKKKGSSDAPSDARIAS